MNRTSEIKPIRINSDIHAKYLKSSDAHYILNQQRNVGGAGKNKSLFGNTKVADVDKPAGESYSIGTYPSEETAELYSWHWNSLDHFFIRRETATDTDIIYNGSCIDLGIDPEHAASEFRAFMVVDKGRTGEHGIHGKYLVWSFGKRQPNFLDVELSLMTDSFNLDVFEKCVKNPCDYVNLEFRQPQKCIIASVDDTSVDIQKSNQVADKTWQFRYRYRSYDGRYSEYSPISSMIWIDHPACIKDSSTFPRCFSLQIPSGDAFVEEIEILFRNDNGTQWFLYDSVKKYGEYTAPTQKWYEREIVLDGYNEDACYFMYSFCGDRQCKAVPTEDTDRITNQMPNTAQAIIPIDNRLGFLNPTRGNDPLPLAEKNKISFSTVVDDSDCQFETVKIKVALIIHNEYHSQNQFIYTMEDGDPNEEKPTNQISYGGLMPMLNGGFENGANYGQHFDGDSKNFKVYVEGTEYWTELKQVFVRNYDEFEDTARVTNMDKDSTARSLRNKVKDDEYFMSIGTLIVPKGTRGVIRVMSQHAQGLEPNTSTSVLGVINNRRDYKGDRPHGRFDYTEVKEISFSACTDEKEVDLTNTPFFVSDMASDVRTMSLSAIGAFLTQGSFAIDGYVKDANKAPVEYAKLRYYDSDVIASGLNPFVGQYFLAGTTETDHNGYYFFTFKTRFKIDISIETSPSGFSVVQTIPRGVFDRGKVVHNNYTVGGDDYATDFTRLIKVLVKDCNGSPMTGISVAVEGSKSSETDIDGVATLALRNNENQDRNVRVYIMQSSVCLFRGCDGECNPCMDVFNVDASGSYSGNPTDNLGSVSYRVFGNTSAFLKHGGRYEFVATMIGNGRCSFVQDNNWFLDIPTVQALQGHSAVRVVVNFSSKVIWPPWVEYVSFSRSKNLKIDDYLQWVIDDIEYVDRDGNPANQLAASNLRLTIQSLNDYNEKYFFKTNTKYQYTAGDRVEFITDGDGNIYNQVINTLVLSPFFKKMTDGDEEPPADFFNQLLVNNDDALDSLGVGSVIEIQKTKVCETEPRFQEICSPIPVENMPLSFRLHTFDTYLLPRQIPGNTVNFTFEHHSVSDFWGDHIDDAGRLNAKNEFEREQRLGRAMMVTDSWSEYGTGIGVNKFRSDQIKIFQGIEGGDIIAAYIWDAKIMMAICQHDHFLAIVGDDFLRVGSDNLVKVTPTEQIVSNPQSKPSGRYGCSYNDVGSVYFSGGYASWIDSIRGALPVSGPEQPTIDIAQDQIGRYIQSITKTIMHYNTGKQPVEKIRYCTGYDPHNASVMITMKAPRMAGVNNSHGWGGLNKTISFDPKTREIVTVCAFTPEAYGRIGQYLDKASTFITFFRSDAYAHYVRTDLFNTFYGAPTDRVVTIAANEHPSKEKSMLAIEVQSDKMWFVENVEIDDRNFKSEIPPVRMNRKLNKWNGEFLRNINSRGGLYQGSQCEGTHAMITLVRDNTLALAYKTTNAQKMMQDDETDFIFVKYVFVESSGLTQK